MRPLQEGELRALTTAGTLSPPRSPEPSKTSAPGSSEDGIEPVSPPEGMVEPGHLRGTMYPLLYRDGEQAEPRYLLSGPFPSWGTQEYSPCPPVALVHRCAIEGLTRASGCN